MSDRLPLDNQVVVRPLMMAVKGILEGERDRINAVLSTYRTQNGGPQQLGPIIVGRRPSRNIREQFPNIVIISTSRSTEWSHSRVTKDTATLRIFCNVLAPESDIPELMMLDLTDVVNSILMQNPVFFWEGMTGDPPTPVIYQSSTASVLGISHGTVDSGYVKAGQIDWACQYMLLYDNINFHKEGAPMRTANALSYLQNPSHTVVANTVFPVQPVITALDTYGAVAWGFQPYVSLSIKPGTGVPGAKVLGHVVTNPVSGVYLFNDIRIDTPGDGYVLLAQAEGITLAESSAITVKPKPSIVTLLSEITQANAGEAFDLTFEVKDTHGVVADAYNGLCALHVQAPEGGGVFNTTPVVFSNGVATLRGAWANIAGTYTITPVTQDVPGQSFTLEVV